MRRAYLLLTAEEEAIRGATFSKRPFEQRPDGGVEAAQKCHPTEEKNRKGTRG